jgi:hypothetical protein
MCLLTVMLKLQVLRELRWDKPIPVNIGISNIKNHYSTRMVVFFMFKIKTTLDFRNKKIM